MTTAATAPSIADADRDRQALEYFVVDNPELERLESLLGQINIFEAVGMAHQEIRHSAFLCFLLDPHQPHGLGDRFLREILAQASATAAIQTTATPAPLSWLPDSWAAWDLSDTRVECEVNRIDILARSRQNRLVVVIENKIWAGEHGDQLAQYRMAVAARYPGWRIMYLYLTPHGRRPSDAAYIPISYRSILAWMETLLREPLPDLAGTDLSILLRHYVQMMRRRIVGDSDIAQLCNDIYRQHKRAIDLIIAHLPNHQQTLRRLMESLVRENEGLILDNAPSNGLQFVSFIPRSWDTLLPTGAPGDFSPARRLLLFVLCNMKSAFYISLTIRPGAPEDRQRLLEIAQKHGPLLGPAASLASNYIELYRRDLLTGEWYENSTSEILVDEARRQWEDFLATDLPAVEAIFYKELQTP